MGRSISFNSLHTRFFAVLYMLLASTLCRAQSLAVKNDALYDALLIPNLGMEVRAGKHTTVDVEGTYDPLSFSSERKWKNWSLCPEVRFWGCHPFSGMFVGINALCGGFNVSRMDVFGLKGKRAQCRLFYGGGLTLGNHYVISPCWGLEAKANVGFVHMPYSRYRCGTCGYKEKNVTTNYIGPTNISISLIYIIK